MHYVYVLFSLRTNSFYKGITNNIDRRTKEHFEAKTAFSKNRLPLKLVHVEICETREDARNLEKFFKSGFGREVIKEIYHMSEWRNW